MGKSSGPNHGYTIVPALLLLVFAAFYRVISSGFVFDDWDNLVRNPVIRFGLSRAGALWALKTTYMGSWHPLAWYSHMLDVELFGLKPWGHHLTSLVIHALNTVLLFALVRRLTGQVWKSAFVAALFGVHPLHVESVAWISERRDVLSTLFWILTTWAYVRYVRTPGMLSYGLMTGLFALGLMTKPMLVTLPFVLVLLDYWPLGISGSGMRGWAKRIWEKDSLLALSAASCVLAFIAQGRAGALASGARWTSWERLSNALVSYVIYVMKAIWPTGLGGFYPHPGSTLPGWQVVGSAVILVAVSAAVVLAARAGRRYLAVGWFWYLGTLLPVIQLVQVGSHARADRYTYVPLIGLFIIAAWGIPDLVLSRRATVRRGDEETGRVNNGLSSSLPVAQSPVLFLTAGATLLALTVCSWVQVGYWHDQETFWRRAIAVTSRNYIAHYNLGCVLAGDGRSEDAIGHFSAAIRAAPDHPEAHNNLGVLLASKGDTDQARLHYVKAIEADPRYADPHVNLGSLLADEGDLDEAIEHYQAALAIAPHDADANFNMGVVLSRKKDLAGAVECYREAITVRPNHVEAHAHLASALYELGLYADAWDEIRRVEEFGGAPDSELMKKLALAMPKPRE